MSDVALPLFAHITSRKLVTSGGSTFTLPEAKLGDTWDGELSFIGDDGEGNVSGRTLNVVGFKAQIGPIMAPPTKGKFKLVVNGTATGEISYGASESVLAAALGGSSIVTSVTKDDDGCWVVRLVDAEGTIAAADDAEDDYNTLKPQSFVRCRSSVENDVTYWEIRLIVAPYAFTDTLTPNAVLTPDVERLLEGQEETGEDPALNEIQQVYFPASFAGSYYLTWNGRRTRILGIADGPDEMAAALNAMYDDGLVRFAVTNPEKQKAAVEFVGRLAGASQNLLAVEVVSLGTASTSAFRLPLTRANFAAALRKDKTLKTTFEIEVRYVGADEDPEEEGVEIRTFTVQADVTIVREAIFAEMMLTPDHNWLATMGRRIYIPFDPGSVITGSQTARVVIGDGLANSIVINHGMDTDEISSILVRENESGGMVLGPGEYAAEITDEDQVTLTFPYIPDTNSLVVMIATINNVATFQDHLHPISSVTGEDPESDLTLREELDALALRLSTLEELVAVTGELSRTDPTKDLSLEWSRRTEIFPGAYPIGFNFETAAKAGTGLRAAPLLLPAIHDATVVAISTVLDDGELPSALLYAGHVFLNDTGASIHLPARIGLDGSYVASGEMIASDGRVWYGVDRRGETTSYFAAAHARSLFQVSVNSRMLRAGQTIGGEFDLSLQLLRANVTVKMLLRIEVGVPTVQAVPVTTADNLDSITWAESPMLEQAVVLTGDLTKHHFGLEIRRDSDGAFSASQLRYTGWTPAGGVPAAADFILRGTLLDLDMQNEIAAPRGHVFLDFKPTDS